jgi:hypothetical protein
MPFSWLWGGNSVRGLRAVSSERTVEAEYEHDLFIFAKEKEKKKNSIYLLCKNDEVVGASKLYGTKHDIAGVLHDKVYS